MEPLRRTRGNVSIVATSLPFLDFEGEDVRRLAAALGVRPPAVWPPEHNDEGTRNWMRKLLTNHPDEPGYTGWYVIGDGELVGSAGFKGPPDAAGEVEIGYSVVAPQQRKGFASGAVELLADYAFADPRVLAVRAETLPDGIASQGVLARCGFVADGIRLDPEDGEVFCFRRNR